MIYIFNRRFRYGDIRPQQDYHLANSRYLMWQTHFGSYSTVQGSKPSSDSEDSHIMLNLHLEWCELGTNSNRL